MIRTTIELPPDLHGLLTSLASSSRKSLSQTAVELIRRGLDLPTSPAQQAPQIDISATTGLPLVRLPRAISAEDVRALEDES